MDGILNINKPPARTSSSVVSMLKRLTRERRVGHAGTLDPMASGVLPVCFGQGTRVVEFLMEAHKAYKAQIELGIATDTHDSTGKIIQQADSSRISRQQMELALDSFRGTIQQTPPMYSALKYHGQRLYKLARAGITVNRQSRQARIHRLKFMAFEPPLVTLEIECGRGTYIRSLAHDLGELLGCGAHLKGLVRLRYGPFDIADAIPLAQLADGNWRHLVYPIDVVLSHLSAVVLSDDRGQVIKKGGSVAMEDGSTGANLEERCRAYNEEGRFLALLRFNPESGKWRPEKVFV